MHGGGQRRFVLALVVINGSEAAGGDIQVAGTVVVEVQVGVVPVSFRSDRHNGGRLLQPVPLPPVVFFL